MNGGLRMKLCCTNILKLQQTVKENWTAIICRFFPFCFPTIHNSFSFIFSWFFSFLFPLIYDFFLLLCCFPSYCFFFIFYFLIELFAYAFSFFLLHFNLKNEQSTKFNGVLHFIVSIRITTTLIVADIANIKALLPTFIQCHCFQFAKQTLHIIRNYSKFQ